MSVSAWISPVAEIVSASVALGGAAFVLYEYRNRRREARFDYARAIEARYEDNPLIDFAVTCLDWGAGCIPVPPDYQAFTGKSGLQHDPELLYRAVRPKLLRDVAEDTSAILYRQAFVALFSHLEVVMGLWHRGYLDAEDLPKTRWVIHELCDWQYRSKKPEDWFTPAMAQWYPDVARSGLSLTALSRRFNG